MKVVVTCPFCGETHETYRNPYINIVCSCNAKYYANTSEWLNRNTGERKKVMLEEDVVKILNAAAVICKECPATGAPGYDCEHCIVREIVNNATM